MSDIPGRTERPHDLGDVNRVAAFAVIIGALLFVLVMAA